MIRFLTIDEVRRQIPERAPAWLRVAVMGPSNDDEAEVMDDVLDFSHELLVQSVMEYAGQYATMVSTDIINQATPFDGSTANICLAYPGAMAISGDVREFTIRRTPLNTAIVDERVSIPLGLRNTFPKRDIITWVGWAS